MHAVSRLLCSRTFSRDLWTQRAYDHVAPLLQEAGLNGVVVARFTITTFPHVSSAYQSLNDGDVVEIIGCKDWRKQNTLLSEPVESTTTKVPEEEGSPKL
eukprot:TRINITY_DN68089_c8_g1_i2.p1 TRINITY_DN68089_c8_g1~~TRINITY_DN68089_c8_g1_i2.p1  ORF type:complete len:100 (+),score=6.70 TRINITY_DN68089_c8_g1_i2:35-334(+)